MTTQKLKQNIKISFFHYPYLLKKACIDIVQFIELHTRFEMYNQYDTHGFYEQLRWESLVMNYLELQHSYIDKQRKTNSNFTDHTGIDLNQKREDIIGMPTIEHQLLSKARRAIHHKAYSITHFSAVPDKNNKSMPSPDITWHNIELNSDERTYVTENFFNGGDKLSTLFLSHCKMFITTSSKLGNMYLNEENYKIPQSS